MTEIAAPGARSGKIGPELLQLSEEIERMMSVPPESGSSFTALLELPATKAIELLHLPDSDNAQASPSRVKRFQKSCFQSYRCSPVLSANSALVDRVARFSATADESPDTSSVPPNSSKVKSEPTDTFSTPISSSPLVLDPAVVNKNGRSVKRKEREKKAKSSPKKCKNVAEESGEDAEKLPYVHVRARRGQATDSHSIAERARREKINARMKLLQELVPGCNRISGTALVLDEIINHVQSLQRQVEYLSMRLATVNPRVDFNFGGLLATESGSLVDSNLTSMAIPLVMPEVQVNENRQQHQQQWHFDMYHPSLLGREEQGNNFLTTENSLLSYDSSANSVSLHSNQLKMEL